MCLNAQDLLRLPAMMMNNYCCHAKVMMIDGLLTTSPCSCQLHSPTQAANGSKLRPGHPQLIGGQGRMCTCKREKMPSPWQIAGGGELLPGDDLRRIDRQGSFCRCKHYICTHHGKSPAVASCCRGTTSGASCGTKTTASVSSSVRLAR